MVLCEIFLVSAWLTFVFFTFVLVSRTGEKKTKNRRWCVGACFSQLTDFYGGQLPRFYGPLSNLRGVSLAHLRFLHVCVGKSYRKKKLKKEKIAVGVCGTVFRSFLIFTVISCLVFMVLYQIFVVSAWLTFVFFMFVSVSRTKKKN